VVSVPDSGSEEHGFESEMNKLLMTKVSGGDRNIKVNIVGLC